MKPAAAAASWRSTTTRGCRPTFSTTTCPHKNCSSSGNRCAGCFARVSAGVMHSLVGLTPDTRTFHPHPHPKLLAATNAASRQQQGGQQQQAYQQQQQQYQGDDDGFDHVKKDKVRASCCGLGFGVVWCGRQSLAWPTVCPTDYNRLVWGCRPFSYIHIRKSRIQAGGFVTRGTSTLSTRTATTGACWRSSTVRALVYMCMCTLHGVAWPHTTDQPTVHHPHKPHHQGGSG